MKKSSSVFFLSAFLLFSPGMAKEEKPPISSDRPGVFFSSDTVPWGAAQLEVGAEYQRFRLHNQESRLETDLLGTPLALRVGLFENLEFRLNSFGYTHLDQTLRMGSNMVLDDSKNGFSSPSVGFKWQLIGPEEDRERPLFGFIVSWEMPVGTRTFRPQKSVFSTTALLDFPLPNDFFLTLNAGLALPYDRDSERRFVQAIGALAVARPLNASTSFFLEVAGGGPQSDGGEGEALIDGGFLFLLTNSVQVDVAVSRGITRFSTDWGATAGLSLYVF